MLAAAIPLAGRVLDADGVPVSGARIVARARVAGAVPVPDGLYAVTDRDGGFTIPLAAGEHTVTASLANHPDAQTVVRIGPDAAPAPLTLRFVGSTGVATKPGKRRSR